MAQRSNPAKATLEKELLQQQIRRESLEADLVQLRIKEEERLNAKVDASDDAVRNYFFLAPIAPSSVHKCISTLNHWSRRDPGEPITIVLDSPGGSVIDGLHLFDFLLEIKRRGHHLTIITRGYAASMGGIILQAADHRVLGRYAWMLIHEISSGAVGKASEMEDELKLVKRLQEQAIEILAERSTLTERQIVTRWKRKDWWLDSAEALKLGFCDVVE